MRLATTFCAVISLVIALSFVEAGVFACQIDCAVASAPAARSHAGSCNGHNHMPGHDNSPQQHTGHTHSKIIAATQSSFQRTTLQRAGLLPQTGETASALARANCAPRFDMATAKSPSPIFTTPVLRI